MLIFLQAITYKIFFGSPLKKQQQFHFFVDNLLMDARQKNLPKNKSVKTSSRADTWTLNMEEKWKIFKSWNFKHHLITVNCISIVFFCHNKNQFDREINIMIFPHKKNSNNSARRGNSIFSFNCYDFLSTVTWHKRNHKLAIVDISTKMKR